MTEKSLIELGMAKRGGPCGLVRGPHVKNAGRANLFNPLTRISPPRISSQPARASSGAGWPANPQEKKSVIFLMCADDGEDYNYEKMDENSSKATSNVIEMEECQ